MDVPEGGSDVLMTATESIDLGQDLATDCSVVASLCAAIRQFGPKTGSVRKDTRRSPYYRKYSPD